MGSLISTSGTSSTRPTIASTLTHYQHQSPLFSVLPGEIRNEIFALALVQYEDNESAYPKDSYWYRPGFAGPRRSSSALLRTCKLAYLEGQKVFLNEVEWAFWFDRGPEGRSRSPACIQFFRDLSPQNVKDLQKVRFFTQMYWLESGGALMRIFREPNFRPTTLTITIRYSDWWFWESNEPLRMNERWLKVFEGPPGLKELRVEYETLSWKREEMMNIVERNKKWKLAVKNGVVEGEEEEHGEAEGHLSAEGTELVEWKWKGPSKLDGHTWAHHGDGDEVEYVVVTDTWRFAKGPMSAEEAEARGPALSADDQWSGYGYHYASDDEDEEEGSGAESDSNYDGEDSDHNSNQDSDYEE